MKTISIASIKVGTRYRKEMGDLETLAKSIESEGLLQPIGVTKDLDLVFGERRLRACRDILKRDQITVRVVDVTSIIAGEYAENEIRKDFTPSERVAIAKALEVKIPERRGNPSIRRNCDELKGRTDKLVAKKAGFPSRDAYHRAKKVVEYGSSNLVEAMDSGKMAISTAARVAEIPIAEQNMLLKADPRTIFQTARTLSPSLKRLPNKSDSKKTSNKRDFASELFGELKNHRLQLENILGPKCGDKDKDVVMKLIEKRTILRLLREIEELINSLEQACSVNRKQS